MKKILLTVLFTFLLAACAPQQGAIPTHQAVAMRYENPSPKEVLDFCIHKGGKYEEWQDEDGSKHTYCMLPEGYGCDPILFFQGTCGLE